MPVDISRDAEDFLNKTFELDHNARPMAGELLVHAFYRSAANFRNGAGNHI